MKTSTILLIGAGLLLLARAQNKEVPGSNINGSTANPNYSSTTPLPTLTPDQTIKLEQIPTPKTADTGTTTGSTPHRNNQASAVEHAYIDNPLGTGKSMLGTAQLIGYADSLKKVGYSNADVVNQMLRNL